MLRIWYLMDSVMEWNINCGNSAMCPMVMETNISDKSIFLLLQSQMLPSNWHSLSINFSLNFRMISKSYCNKWHNSMQVLWLLSSHWGDFILHLCVLSWLDENRFLENNSSSLRTKEISLQLLYLYKMLIIQIFGKKNSNKYNSLAIKIWSVNG